MILNIHREDTYQDSHLCTSNYSTHMVLDNMSKEIQSYKSEKLSEVALDKLYNTRDNRHCIQQGKPHLQPADVII